MPKLTCSIHRGGDSDTAGRRLKKNRHTVVPLVEAGELCCQRNQKICGNFYVGTESHQVSLDLAGNTTYSEQLTQMITPETLHWTGCIYPM